MKRLMCVLLALTVLLPLGAVTAEDADIWLLPNKSEVLTRNLWKIGSKYISQITGEKTENKTSTRFDVAGVDLGSMAYMDGRIYMFGGDTFDDIDKRTGWRCNTLFIIEDDDITDGLTITDAVCDLKGHAKECISGAKIDNVEMTAIPTNIFAVGDTLYCVFMSVRHWNAGGGWVCNYSMLAKSTDQGQNWTKVKNVKWPGNSNFIQTANAQVGDTMYFWGIPAGRSGGVALMKCDVRELEDFEAYSYLTDVDEENNPVWVRGSAGVSQAKTVVKKPVGELSVMYNEYLGNFIMTYLEEGRGIMIREGVTPWGKWSQPQYLNQNISASYGPFMLPQLVENDGQVFYFVLSSYFPVYNILYLKATLPESLIRYDK